MTLGFMNRLPQKRSLSSITIFKNATDYGVSLVKTKRDFLQSIGYLNCTNNPIRLDLLLILAHARIPNYQNC